MYLSKLEIFGFKSFADKTTIEFGSGVSAIVGPNGSGKSNIVDALRWVLGEQGDKILRSGKREDVVFNGTKFRKPLSVAEVAVTIENNKNKLPTEYSEVQIARRFYRSGETEYFLNGTRVRLKDIRELFIDTGIGPDAYSVIELKMVETILSDIKHERRKLFEEAAGVISYKHNRDLTFNRLDAVHESLLRVNDIIREKQRNVNALERQAKRNEEAKLVAEELKSLELKVGLYEYENLLYEISEIKGKEHLNISLKSSLAEDLKLNDIILDDYRNEMREFDEKLSQMNSRLLSKKDEINLLEKDNLVLEEKINNLNNEVTRLRRETENLNTLYHKNTELRVEVIDKIKTLYNAIYISEFSLTEKKSKVDVSIKIISERKNELLEIGKKIKDINKIVAEKKSLYQENKINYENNLLQLGKLSELNHEHLMHIEKLQNEKNELEEDLQGTTNKLKLSEKMYLEKEEEKRLLGTKLSNLGKEISNRTFDYQKIKSNIEYLVDLSENMEDYAEGVKFLIKDSKGKNIFPVLDIIEVEDKFKIPIETALGEVASYLVVQDSGLVFSLIDQLSENKKGKVTFILNDVLNHKNFNYVNFSDDNPEFMNMRGVYGFADKFVKCKDESFQLLIQYILDEFVIVDNLSTARLLAEDNYYKFITLEGDIVTKGFIRAGGKVNEESIKLVRQKKIDMLSLELNAIQKIIDNFEIEHENIQINYDSIAIDQYKNDVDTIKKNRIIIEQEISKLDFKNDQLNKSITDNDFSYENIDGSNKKLGENINVLITEVRNAENEQYNLDKELIFLTDEFNIIEQNFSEDSAEYNNFNLEFQKIKNELKNEERIFENINKLISDTELQITSNNNEVLSNEKNLEILKKKVSINTDILNTSRVNINIIEEQYNAERSLYEEKKSDQHKIDVDQRQRRLDFDNVSQKLINSQIRIKENEIKSQQIRDYIYKKYEKDLIRNEVIGSEQTVHENFDIGGEKKNVEDLNERLKQLGGGYQKIFFEDFENEKADLKKLIEQKEDLLESEKDIRKTIEKINKEAHERFLGTFEHIRENFITIFKQLFQDGDEANLKIVYEEDEEGKLQDDPLEAKIEITAKPRGKRPTSIELLSGGEKTLTAIALLFAIYLVKPSPFCVLDEVDAPLDVANLSRFNNMIRRFSENTQFILITHNERTMESVDRLYGVTMQEAGVTTIVETKFKSDEKLQA